MLVRGPDTTAAASGKIAPDALARQVLARRWKFGSDLGPVALKLLGNELSKAGQGALAHFRSGDTDHDGVIGPDRDPGVNLWRTIGGPCDLSAKWELETEHQSAAQRGLTNHEPTSAKLWNTIHERLPRH